MIRALEHAAPIESKKKGFVVVVEFFVADNIYVS